MLGYLGVPKCQHKCYKRGIERDSERRGPCDCGGRDRSNGATSQGMPAATRSWKCQGTDSPLDLPEGVQPCQHLDLGLFKLIWPPEQ